MTILKASQGDITKLKVDVIVNAANSSLLGGGGVDGAIHRAAGPELLKECRNLNGCNAGEAKLTAGYKLSSRFVIHTVGPIWNGGRSKEPTLLADCYRNSLALAIKNKVATIAFPAISTGVYRFPAPLACEIAIKTVREVLQEQPESGLTEVIFCCFDYSTFELYQNALA